MIQRIEKNANVIIKYIEDIIIRNNGEGCINGTEFEFVDKYETYKTKEFKDILDNHFKDINITYTFEEEREHVAKFKFILHDWVK